MGAVATAALADAAAGTVAIAHVGDSRAYRLRHGDIEQLTTDHSLVSELVESGILTPEEAERHPQRSAITRALGTEPDVEVDVSIVDAAPGDVFLLCSDGLTTMLADAEIVTVVERAGGAPAEAAEALVAAANDRGSVDNVTVVLFEIVAGDEEEVPETIVESPTVAEAADSNGHARTADDEHSRDEAGNEGDESAEPGGSLRRHGAGAGGRLAAIALLLGIVAIGLLVLYWEFR
jgi:protein phosphatase